MSYGKAEELPKWALLTIAASSQGTTCLYSISLTTGDYHRPQSTNMAHLTKPVKYDIKDSNIALLGSDVRISI